MCPVSGTNSHNPQDRLRQSLYSLAPHTSLLMPFSGSTGPVVHLHGLTGQEKPSVKADLAIYTHVLGVPGQYKSVALMLSHKMDFNCCAYRDGFCKSSQPYNSISFTLNAKYNSMKQY